MTKLLTIAEKQTQAAALAAQLAEYKAAGGRVLTVTKDTVIEPQPKSDWITPTTAKPLQVIESPRRNQSPKIEPKPPAQPKQPKQPATPKTRYQKGTGYQKGNVKRAAILDYMRKAGEPVTRTQIAEALKLNKKGGLLDMMRDMLAKDLIKVSSVVGLVHYFEVTK